MDAFSSCASPRTTDGTIALSNLEAHIDGLELSRGRGELDSPAWSELIDLITLRAQDTRPYRRLQRACGTR